MSYIYEVIRDTPAAFYQFDEEGSVATDYSGYSRDAAMSFTMDSSKLPLVAGTLIGTKMASGDYVTYPEMGIWGNSQNFAQFSIEMWIYDYGVTTDTTLFAPVDADGPLLGSGIFLNDGRLTFSVGDGTGLTQPSTQMTVHHQLTDNTLAHHLVFKYGPAGLSIVVDGGEYFSTMDRTVQQNKWTHEITGFITQVDDSNGILIDCLAVYPTQLTDSAISRHYELGNKVISPADIIVRYPGGTIPFDGNGKLEYISQTQPEETGGVWKTIYEKNIHKDSGTLTLKQIPPAITSDSTETYSGGALILQATQSLTVKDFREHIGRTTGVVAGRFYMDTATHDSASEFCLFTISSNGDSISLIQDSSQNFVLRHSYYERNSIVETTIDTTYGAVTYDAWTEVALMFSDGLYTLYIGDLASPVQYNDSANKKFSIEQADSMTIGELGGAAYFQEKVKDIGIWKEIPTESYTLTSLIDTTTNYTLPLTSNLNVSQIGYAELYYNVAGIDVATEAKANFGPVCANLTIEQSTDQTTYNEVFNNSSLYGFTYGDNIYSTTGGDLFFKITLETNDSYNDVTHLDYFNLEISKNSYTNSVQSLYNVELKGDFNTGYLDYPTLAKYDHDGVRFNATGYAEITADSGYEHVLADGRILPAQPPVKSMSVGMFVKQNEADAAGIYLYSNKGGTELSLTNGGTGLVVTGYDNMYINSILASGGETLEVGEWTHIVLTLDAESGVRRTNLVTNPQLGVDTTKWVDYAEANGSRSSEVSPPMGTYVYKLIADGISTTDYGFNLTTGTGGYAATAGLDYFASVFLQADATSREASVGIMFYDSGGSLLLETRSSELSDYPAWSLFAVKETAPASTAYVTMDVKYESGVPDLEVHYAANPIIEQSDVVLPYFDGSVSGAYWEGTADASASSYDVGIYIDGNDVLFVGGNGVDTPSKPSVSFSHVSIYNNTLSQNDVDNIFQSYLGRNTEEISDGGIEWEYNQFYVPMEIGGSGSEDPPAMTDIEPIAVAANWEIVSSG